MLLNKVNIVALLLLAVGLLGAGAAWQAAEEKPAPTTVPCKRLMKVPSPIDGIIAVIGREIAKDERAPADQVITVRSRDGEQKYRRLDVGDRIKEGAMLARLDDRLARNEVAIQKAKVNGARANYEGAIKAKYEAQAYLDRTDRLVMEAGRKGSIVSPEDYSRAVIARDRSKYEEESKKASLDIANLKLERAEINLEKYTIRSPVQGIITTIYKERGEAAHRLEPVFQIEILPDR